MILTEYRFTPNHVSFRRGVSYRLILGNPGKELHEFTAPDFLKGIALDNPDILVTEKSDVVLHPGERKELRFVAEKSGRYRLTCADHEWDGMTGEIVIE